MITVLLIILCIMFILALLYPLGCLLEKHMQSRQKKYQEHIDDLVTQLFPPSSIQTPAIDTRTTHEPDPQEVTVQYQEAKRKMVADIRTYFNQRKINAAIANMPGPDELAPVNPSAGTYEDRGSYEELSFPTPPSIERLME